MIKRLFAIFAVLALFLAGCGDDGGGGDDADTEESDDTGSTTTTEAEEEEEEAVALEDWVEQADEICAEAQEASDELGEPADIDELVEALPDLLDILEEEVEAISELETPEESADEVEEAVGLLNDQLELLQEASDRVDDGDDPTEVFTDINEEGTELQDRLDELAEDLGMEECGSDDEETDGTTTTTDGGSTGDEPFSYGDDEEFDALYDECGEGNGAACDELYWASPVGSDYEEFARTCGGAVPDGAAGFCEDELGGEKVDIGEDEAFTYGDDPVLDGLWDACEGGDMAACDELYWTSPVDSDYEEFGNRCGELVAPEDPAPFSCEEEFG
jgi:hypothetical protein